MKATKLQVLSSLIYLHVVVTCIVLALSFKALTHIAWAMLLTVLTLPFSLLSLFFAHWLTRGERLELFALMYVVYAGLNVVGMNALINYLKGARATKTGGEEFNPVVAGNKEKGKEKQVPSKAV